MLFLDKIDKLFHSRQLVTINCQNLMLFSSVAGVSLVGRETCVISVFLLLAVYMARAPNLGNVFVKKGGLAVSATEVGSDLQ